MSLFHQIHVYEKLFLKYLFDGIKNIWFRLRNAPFILKYLISFSFKLFISLIENLFNIVFYYFRVEKKSPAIFTGGGQDFLSEIGLFRKLAGNRVSQYVLGLAICFRSHKKYGIFEI